jgi:hypothetical protein
MQRFMSVRAAPINFHINCWMERLYSRQLGLVTTERASAA